MQERRPVQAVLDDPRSTEDVVTRLVLSQQLLDFAHRELKLPDNGSYRHFVDLGRPAVVWNVVATPEFSLTPRRWCYPVVGCVTYRGYFKRAAATRYAAGLRARGDDVFVGGAAAYSTLGRFRDPLLSTMLGSSDTRLASLLFHELTHHRLYVQGDAAFSEALAGTIERAGVRRWLNSRGDLTALCQYEQWLSRRGEVIELLAAGRRGLNAVYAASADAPAVDRWAAKQAALSRLRERYRLLRADWQGPPHFDGWFDSRLNNARLIALATYDALGPALDALLAEAGGDFDAFFARADALAELPPADRAAALRAIPVTTGQPAPAAGCSG